MRPKRILLAGIGVLTALLSLVWGETDEERIKSVLKELATASAVAQAEHPFEALGRAGELSSYFSFPIVLDLSSSEYEELFTLTKTEFKQKVVAARKTLGSLEVSLESADIEVRGDDASAEVRVSILGSLLSEDGRFLEIRSARVDFIRDDEWVVKRVTHLRNERDAG